MQARSSGEEREAVAPAPLEQECWELRRRDPRLAELIDRVGPCGLRTASDPYRELVRTVLHQQLAGAAARAIHGRLCSHFGGRVPEPERLAVADEDTLRELGLSRQKAATLRAVAQAFASGRLGAAQLRRMSDADVVAAVTQIRGIGEWSAHMLLIFALGRLDVLPVGDFGVRKGARRLYGLPELPGRRELEALAEGWQPYRSIAAWYLWRQ
jgi:3-methyladenine DNA glycosylase/8-oxoguanine DNA glycosylase